MQEAKKALAGVVLNKFEMKMSVDLHMHADPMGFKCIALSENGISRRKIVRLHT